VLTAFVRAWFNKYIIMFNIDYSVQLTGTLANGEQYSATVELTRPIARMMERITAQDPYRYNRLTWLNLYYEAAELLEQHSA